MLKIYVDAATKGNPGPSGVGVLMVTNTERFQYAFPLKNLYSNHEAEFQGMILGLQLAIEKQLQHENTFVYTDSKIVAETVQKNYAKRTEFKNYLTEVQELIKNFPLCIIQWIPEKENKGADNLARQGLQKALKNKIIK